MVSQKNVVEQATARTEEGRVPIGAPPAIANAQSDPDVVARPVRRRLTIAYKITTRIFNESSIFRLVREDSLSFDFVFHLKSSKFLNYILPVVPLQYFHLHY